MTTIKEHIAIIYTAYFEVTKTILKNFDKTLIALGGHSWPNLAKGLLFVLKVE